MKNLQRQGVKMTTVQGSAKMPGRGPVYLQLPSCGGGWGTPVLTLKLPLLGKLGLGGLGGSDPPQDTQVPLPGIFAEPFQGWGSRTHHQ